MLRAICAPRSFTSESGERFTHPHSLWYFVRVAEGVDSYMHATPRDRWLSAPLHLPLCDWLQSLILSWYHKAELGHLERFLVLVMMPRFTGKTFICTKSSTKWAALLDPNLSQMIGSESLKMAEGFLGPIKEVISGEAQFASFTWLYGNWRSRDRSWVGTEIVHAARTNTALTEPSIRCWGAGTGITSLHPDFGWLDDPLSEDKIRNEGTWLGTVVQSIAGLIPAFRPNSFLGVALTRKRDADVAGTYLYKNGVASWTGMPCPDSRIYEKWLSGPLRFKGKWHVYFMQAKDPLSGESVLPMWSTQALSEYEETQPVEFAQEMMNEPGSGEHMPLTRERVEEDMWIHPDSLEFPNNFSDWPRTFHFDTAFKSQKRVGKGDWSVIVRAAHCPRGTGDIIYEYAVGSNRWKHDDFLARFNELLKASYDENLRVIAVTDEAEIGGKTGLWKSVLLNSVRAANMDFPRGEPILLNRAGKHKTIRLTEAAGFWVGGHVYLLRGGEGLSTLVNEMCRIGYSSHDDFADAAADAFCNEVYKPMLLSRASEIREDIRPDDELLRDPLIPRSDDHWRALHDMGQRARAKELDLVDSEENWPYT